MPLATFFKSPHMLLAITTFIWGGNAIAGKFAVGHISPMVLTMFRWGIALAIVAIIARPHLKADWPEMKANWLYLLLMGGFGYTAFNFCLYSALQYQTAVNVTLEQSAMPVVIFILNLVIYRIGIRWMQIVGYALTMIGVVVVVSAGDPLSLLGENRPPLNRGDLYMLAAAIFYGGYSTALRSKPQMHWLSFLTALVAAALLFAMAGATFETAQGNALWPTTVQGVLVALFTGIFPSLVSQGFFIKGVEALGANMAGLYINLVPVFGALLAVAMLGESLHVFHAVAFVLVVGGITIAQRVRG
ncbi:MAG: DMT family transporter [Pseudomonadota bacterium]